ncbi:hypothetical protein BGZ76_008508 [Entomortierella beljakovae]|nr:hypothetical protein BGZ76_008508 [Entomortierella beljakovae]
MELQERWNHLNTDSNSVSLNGSKEFFTRSGIKRQKLDHAAIPNALTNKSFPLSQITSFESLVEHIDSLTLPDQLSSILANRVLQHVLCLQPSHSAVDRISYWLGQELMDLWYWREKTDATRARFATIISKVVEVTVMVKDLLPVIELFLIPYIRTWNGIDHQKEIFTLLSYLRPRSFEDLHGQFLKPLYNIFCYIGPIWKGELFLCYARLLQHWAQIRWMDYLELGKTSLLSEKGAKGLRRLFSELSSNVDYMQTMRAFMTYIDGISCFALEAENNHVAVQHGVLSFFDLASTLTGTYNLPLAVVIPEPAIVYHCFLSDSGMPISRICGIIYQYKQAFEAFEQEQQLQYDLLVQSQMSSQDASGNNHESIPAPAPIEVPGYSRDYVILFNSFVMDICNFLWRNRAYNKTDKNAQGFHINQPTISKIKQICMEGGLSMSNMLSMTHSTALSGYSSRFLKKLEDLQNVPAEKQLKAPVSSLSLKDMASKGGLNITFDDYRIQYLDYLEQKGFDGISQFLFDCITNLLQRKLQNQERQKGQHGE